MTNLKDKKTPVSVFYTKNTEEKERSKKKVHRKGSFDARKNESNRNSKSEFKNSGRSKNEYKNDKKDNRFSSRIESFSPQNTTESDSPWKKQPSKFNRDRPNDERRVNGKDRYNKTDKSERSSDRNPAYKESSERFQSAKNELYVYGENSCKAIAKARSHSIAKVFITEVMLDRFRDLLGALAQDQIGYDIVPAHQIEKLVQSPHHGGIAMIVKRRQGLSVVDYLNDDGYAKIDTILAIDDIANPHNLGGIARTASFFSVNALMVRQPEMAENSAAIKVSEGGMESLQLIKADDMIADLMHLKKAGYKIIAILPVKTQSIKSIALEKAKFNPTKTVFVIFQQINEKITDLADDIISLQGSKEMSALNISVLTGIVLSTWRNRLHLSS